jgi:hypothetical protein
MNLADEHSITTIPGRWLASLVVVAATITVFAGAAAVTPGTAQAVDANDTAAEQPARTTSLGDPRSAPATLSETVPGSAAPNAAPSTVPSDADAAAAGNSHLPSRTTSIGDSVRARRNAEAVGASPESTEPAVPDDSATRELLERVQARWDLKIQRDFAALYGFETPEYRAEHNAEAFARRFGAFSQWHGIDVIRVERPSDGNAVVDVLLDHTFASPLDDSHFRTKTLVREQWKQSDGQWYHATPYQPLPVQTVEAASSQHSAQPASDHADQSSSRQPQSQ